LLSNIASWNPSNVDPLVVHPDESFLGLAINAFSPPSYGYKILDMIFPVSLPTGGRPQQIVSRFSTSAPPHYQASPFFFFSSSCSHLAYLLAKTKSPSQVPPAYFVPFIVPYPPPVCATHFCVDFDLAQVLPPGRFPPNRLLFWD